MEAGCTLPRLQVTTTCTYPEPDQFRQYPFYFLAIFFNIIINLNLYLPDGIFTLTFSTKICKHLSSTYTCHMPDPSHFFRFDPSHNFG